VTIFELDRMRPIALIALYQACHPHAGRPGTDYPGQYAVAMTRDQLAAAIAATPKGARLLDGGGGR
jgi:hypothetical protein